MNGYLFVNGWQLLVVSLIYYCAGFFACALQIYFYQKGKKVDKK